MTTDNLAAIVAELRAGANACTPGQSIGSHAMQSAYIYLADRLEALSRSYQPRRKRAKGRGEKE